MKAPILGKDRQRRTALHIPACDQSGRKDGTFERVDFTNEAENDVCPQCSDSSGRCSCGRSAIRPLPIDAPGTSGARFDITSGSAARWSCIWTGHRTSHRGAPGTESAERNSFEDNDFRPCLDRRNHSFRQERSGGSSQPRRPACPSHEGRPVRETAPYGVAKGGDREIDGFAVVRIGFRLGIADGPVRVRVRPDRLHRLIRPDLPRGLACLDGCFRGIRVALTQGREQDRRPSPFCLHQWRHNGSFCPAREMTPAWLIALSGSCNSASGASARIRAPRCFPVRLILTACAHPVLCRQCQVRRTASGPADPAPCARSAGSWCPGANPDPLRLRG